MGHSILAAAPFEDFVRDNSPVMAGIICVILGILVIRLIVNTMTRMILLSLLLLMVIFIAAEHEAITECAQTCECRLAGQDVSVAFCNPELPRTGT